MTRRLINRCAIAIGGASLFFFAAVAADHAADAGPVLTKQEPARSDARCW